MKTGRAFVCCLAALLFWLASAPRAYAYLEPGTGSLIVQSIIGGIAGITVAASLYWNKVKGFFRRKRGIRPTDPTNSSRDSSDPTGQEPRG